LILLTNEKGIVTSEFPLMYWYYCSFIIIKTSSFILSKVQKALVKDHEVI